jgi:hypothetical protein
MFRQCEKSGLNGVTKTLSRDDWTRSNAHRKAITKKTQEPQALRGQRLRPEWRGSNEALGIGECLFVLKLLAGEVPERRAAAHSEDRSAHKDQDRAASPCLFQDEKTIQKSTKNWQK